MTQLLFYLRVAAAEDSEKGGGDGDVCRDIETMFDDGNGRIVDSDGDGRALLDVDWNSLSKGVVR